ncbi:Hypothetical protein GLP15_1127 [Giardia lamblia P15]|uniref:Amino acid transporter transmembrane domain-containing protein n=1 Tax=Giardia intestinalis (strain P15) TaxID=658858 RepID=E1EZ75_GIAIA|nr:Hypothetical protein GLP15_1127 [Giardia lamblia P15]
MNGKDNQSSGKHLNSGKNGGSPKGNVSSVSASFMLISQIVGSALLSIAYIFSRVGLSLMFFVLPLSFAIALALIFPVIEGCYLTQSYSYRALTQKVIGPKFAYVMDAMLILLYFGFLTSYIIIASQSFIGILRSFLPSFDSHRWIPYVMKACVSFLIILPLSLLKSTKVLSAIASVSIFFAMGMAITIPVYYFISLGRNGQVCPRFPSTKPTDGSTVGGFFRPAVPWWPSPSKGLGLGPVPMGFLFFFGYIPLLQGNYTSQLAIPAMLELISGPMYLRMRILKISITVAFIFCTMLYVFTGIFGALLFGKSILPNLLSSFDICADYWITSIKAMYGLVVCITYPIALFPLKLALIAYTKVGCEESPKRWYGLFVAFSFIFLIPGVGIALVYENIAAIFGLVGSLCGGVIYFGVPIWVCYKLPFLRAEYPHDIDKEFKEAADHLGVVRTEAIGTSVLALMLPGSANEALSRARALSNTDPVNVASVKVHGKSIENPVLSIRSVIGVVRGRSFPTATPSFSASQASSASPMSKASKPSSFTVNVEYLRPRTTSIFNSKLTLTHAFSKKGGIDQQSEMLSLTQNSIRISEANKIDSTESTEQTTCMTEDVTNVLPAVPMTRIMEIGAICRTVDPDLERAKMTPRRRILAWSVIVLFGLICVEGVVINVVDFIGKLD